MRSPRDGSELMPAGGLGALGDVPCWASPNGRRFSCRQRACGSLSLTYPTLASTRARTQQGAAASSGAQTPGGPAVSESTGFHSRAEAQRSPRGSSENSGGGTPTMSGRW